ncbi:OmpA family protein [Tenacibaculum sp. FZY0031]|uniref:OmpA family protein n=1 Tax=Tenacibaculum sp. FZY0031 TaxID=3116648 RepID=UPI002EB0F06B|nr:OmpA family protein [Tenacibaculum sp. FZY0031]
MINKKLLFLLITFFLFYSYSFCQEKKIDKANKKYNEIAFIEAIDIYKKVAESGYRSVELFERLANSYYFNARYDEASKWYKELFLEKNTPKAITYLRYSQCLQSIGEQEKAKKLYEQFLIMTGNYNDNNTVNNQKKLIEVSGRYELKPLKINSSGIDFGNAVTNNKLVFASTRDTISMFKRIDAWSGLNFMDLYEAKIVAGNVVGKPVKLKGKVNSKYHETSPTFTKDGKTMYFTRNNKTAHSKSNTKYVRLKIYRAHLKNGKWTDIEDLTINSDHFSTAHPALTKNNTRLYFVSDRPGSIGQTDIFYVPIHSDGTLGKVEAIKNINTPGRESFPFITENDELYFSSDGHYGFGGYDVFYSKIYKDDFGKPINVGSPINTAYDDISFAIKNHKGYISSNRPNGLGYDDIYSFVENKDINDLFKGIIYGTVTNSDTKEVIPNAQVIIRDLTHKEQYKTKTNEHGYYEAEVDIKTNYVIEAVKQNFDGDNAFSKAGKKNREHNLKLTTNSKDVVSGEDIAKLLNITIYFDFNKSNIRPDAVVELEKIVEVLKKYPRVVIRIESHTDSRGLRDYNRILSDKRAKATRNYILSRGVGANRIESAIGYGEDKSLNKCVDGKRCSERDYQVNRRSHFFIVEK